MTTATLTSRQAEALSLLADRGPLTAEDLAQAIGTSRSSVRSTLLSLAAKDLVRRQSLNGQRDVKWERA